nr:hypothetical protein [Mesorhizobium sp.]
MPPIMTVWTDIWSGIARNDPDSRIRAIPKTISIRVEKPTIFQNSARVKRRARRFKKKKYVPNAATNCITNWMPLPILSNLDGSTPSITVNTNAVENNIIT